MESEVFKIAAKILQVEPSRVTRELSPDAVEDWDSMRHTMLLLAVEDEIGVSFSDEDMLSVGNIGDLVDLTTERAKA